MRLSFEHEGKLRIKLNAGNVTRQAHVDPQAVLSRLSLRHGDIIVIECSDSYRQVSDRVLSPVFALSEDAGAALYVISEFASGRDFFALPVYHWVVPFDKPLNLDGASFFVDGRPLGVGRAGFMSMLNDVEKSPAARQPFFLGCHVKTAATTGLAVPFGDLETNLEHVLQGHRVMLDDMNMRDRQ